MPPKNYRKRKQDRITNTGVTPDEVRIDFAHDHYDEASRKIDRKWGVER